MHRTLPSIVALLGCLLGQPLAAGAAQTPPKSPEAKAAPLTIVNINTASAKDLEVLPGIGQKTAARIVEYRQKNGPFKKIEELMNVPGIGEKSFLKLKPQLSVAARSEGEK